MPNVYMDEPVRVQSVGTGGIGFDPPVPVEDVEKISETGREMYGVQGKANVLPNPATVYEGGVMYAEDGAFACDSNSPMEASYNGEIFVASPALTERVPEGTLLKNQLWCNKVVATVGYYWDSVESKLNLYHVFGSKIPKGGSQVTYRMYEKDSPNQPYEFTLENAPNVAAFTDEDEYYKTRNGITALQHHLDFRLCRVRKDSNGNEVERIYSSQYRYVIEDGVVTRTRFKTAATDPSHITDVGLYKPSNSAVNTFAFKLTSNPLKTVLPLVSTNQTYQYEFIIPDSMFTNAPYGLAVIATAGDGAQYVSSAFFKAEDESPFVVTLTPTAQDFSGTMDKTTAEINAAFEAGRKIVFSVPQLNGEVFNADTSIACDTTGGGRYLTAYIINPSNNILIVAWNSPNEESNAYHTAIYPLTPMT